MGNNGKHAFITFSTAAIAACSMDEKQQVTHTFMHHEYQTRYAKSNKKKNGRSIAKRIKKKNKREERERIYALHGFFVATTGNLAKRNL